MKYRLKIIVVIISISIAKKYCPMGRCLYGTFHHEFALAQDTSIKQWPQHKVRQFYKIFYNIIKLGSFLLQSCHFLSKYPKHARPRTFIRDCNEYIINSSMKLNESTKRIDTRKTISQACSLKSKQGASYELKWFFFFST